MALTESAGAPRFALPPVAEYLRSVFALGMSSLRHALPALAFLYFYRLGMNLYLAVSSSTTTRLGGYDRDTLVTSVLLQAGAYLPLLVLIYTPFLPLQDALLMGERRSFAASVRLVLERFIPFVVSAIAQVILVAGPPALLFGSVAILVRTFPARPEQLVRALAVATVVPCVLYVGIIALFMMFATPALILERRGPFAAIRASFALVSSHFGAILGRLIVFFFLLVLTGLFLSLPVGFLSAISAATGSESPAISIAGAIWSAAVSALLFPFSVAALMVLYRAAAPSRGAVAPADAVDPALTPSPRPVTPFVFE